MTRQRFIDHQRSGKERLAVARTKDRTLDSLDSPSDKRIRKYLDEHVGEWASIGDQSVPILLQRSESPREARQKKRRLAEEKMLAEQNENKSTQPLNYDERFILRKLEQRYDELTQQLDYVTAKKRKRAAENLRMKRDIVRNNIENLLKGKTRE